MKKTYLTPELFAHGTVEELTMFFGTSNTDVFTGPNGAVVTTGVGSIDACATTPGSGTCLPN